MIIPSDYACNDFNSFLPVTEVLLYWRPYYFSGHSHGCGDKPRCCRGRCATTCVPVQYRSMQVYSFFPISAPRLHLLLLRESGRHGAYVGADRLPDYSA